MLAPAKRRGHAFNVETVRQQPTRAELEVLQLAASGLTANESARRRWVSPHTITTQRRSVIRKLRAKTLPHAVALAKDQNLI